MLQRKKRESIKQTTDLIRDRWRTRRFITLCMMYVLILAVGYAIGFIKPESLTHYSSLYSGLFTLVGALFGYYFIGAVADDVKHKQEETKQLEIIKTETEEEETPDVKADKASG